MLLYEIGGQAYTTYGGTLVKIDTIINTLLTNANISTKDVCANSERHTLTMSICDKNYKKFPFAIITIKRAKGDSHSRYGETWTDYSVKDVEVNLFDNESLEESIEKARDSRDAAMNRHNKEIAELERKVNELQNFLGMERVSEVMTLCANIYHHRYELFKSNS